MSAVSDIVAAMRGEYLEDCERRLTELRGLYDGLTLHQADRLRDIERHAHAIKGSAFTFGLPEMTLLCGAWEGDMKRVREGISEPPADSVPWQRYGAMFGAMVEGADITGAPGDSVLIWSPFESTRQRMAGLVASRFTRIEQTSTDRDALHALANQSFSAILASCEEDSELDSEQRAALLAAAAAGTGAGLLVENTPEGDLASLRERGAQIL